jgi:hypothetical protein
MVEYKHSFSKALAVGLRRLYEAKSSVNIKELGLTRNQWDNFQKLRYWGLVEQVKHEDGRHASGVWAITKSGVDFIEHDTAIRKSVWTYRGSTIRFDGDTCFFRDVHDTEYVQRATYATEAVPHHATNP